MYGMRTILVTGAIGSGKSAVCRYLSSKGYPVYDSDSRTKALYDKVPGLKEKIEEALGIPFGQLSVIFEDEGKRTLLEGIVYPLVVDDFVQWRSVQGRGTVFLESALALDKPVFDALYDEVWLVEAPYQTRLERNPKVAGRDALQHFDRSRADIVIENDSTKEELYKKIDLIMKTDLAKILSVSGQHGLYEYVAQARNGAIAESLIDKKRTVFTASSRVTTLEDIAIYTSEGEMKLAEVFAALHSFLGDKEAPSPKADGKDLEELFAGAIPNYDADRFYVSHMRKVVDWYSQLSRYASLEFVTDEDRKAEAEAAKEA